MPLIPRSLSVTSARVLNSVAATADAVTSVAETAANYASAMEAHSAHYAATTRTELNLSTEEFGLIAKDRARARITRARLALNDELSDPAFADIFNSIKFDDERPELRVAAE